MLSLTQDFIQQISIQPFLKATDQTERFNETQKTFLSENIDMNTTNEQKFTMTIEEPTDDVTPPDTQQNLHLDITITDITGISQTITKQTNLIVDRETPTFELISIETNNKYNKAVAGLHHKIAYSSI